MYNHNKKYFHINKKKLKDTKRKTIDLISITFYRITSKPSILVCLIEYNKISTILIEKIY